MTDSGWTWAWPWWGSLVALNVIQVIVGLAMFARSRREALPDDASYARIMRTMGLIFVLVACYRSIFVSSYLRQLAWFDSPLNGSLLIRLFAFCAELSFAGLIAKTLLRTNDELPELANGYGRTAPIVLFASILVANLFATSATITKVGLLFALEETCWGIGFVAILPLLILRQRPLSAHRGAGELSTANLLILIFTAGYCVFQLGFNLPSVQWPEALAQLHSAQPDPPYQFGLAAIRDAFLVVHETRDLTAWGGMGFVVWHSGYFTVCVWLVLYLMRGPRLVNDRDAR